MSWRPNVRVHATKAASPPAAMNMRNRQVVLKPASLTLTRAARTEYGNQSTK